MNTFYKVLVLLLFPFSLLRAQSTDTKQSIPLFAADAISVNPSLVGVQPDFTIVAYNEQSFKSHGLTRQNVRFIAPLATKSGIGVDISRVNHGFFNQLQGSVIYAYHAKLNQKIVLHLSLSAFYQNMSFNQTELNDFEKNDPALISYMNNKINEGGSGFAASIISSHFLYGGAFMYNVSQKEVLYDALVRYTLYLKKDFVLLPALKIKNTVVDHFVSGISLGFWYRNSCWLTTDLFYKNTNSISAGCFLSRSLFVSYAYNVNNIRVAFQNTHLISLGLKLGKSSFNSVFSATNQNNPYYDWEQK